MLEYFMLLKNDSNLEACKYAQTHFVKFLENYGDVSLSLE
jgi:hypothetical protein